MKMIVKTSALAAVMVFVLGAVNAEAGVRDPISRKNQPQNGFFESSSRSTASRAYSRPSSTVVSRPSTPSQPSVVSRPSTVQPRTYVAPRTTSGRYIWSLRGR